MTEIILLTADKFTSRREHPSDSVGSNHYGYIVTDAPWNQQGKYNVDVKRESVMIKFNLPTKFWRNEIALWFRSRYLYDCCV